MYYRYKIKKKNSKITRALLLIIIAAALLYTGNRYKKHIFFWKYTYNKLINEIDLKNSAGSMEERRNSLLDFSNIVDNYKSDNQVDPDAFFLSGKLHYYIGVTYLEGRFSELYINNRLNNINPDAANQFIMAVRDIKKGIALLNGDSINDDISLILSWSLFYTGFSDINDIIKLIEPVKENNGLNGVDDVRLYSIIKIMNGMEDEGLIYLDGHGGVIDSIEGVLFLATAEKAAKRFTSAIIHYQDVLNRVKNEKLKKLVHVNLGEIYFNQSLYQESLDQFISGLKIDGSDSNLKIWIGKNYSSLGEKDKARAIWNEVFASDSSNQEVKKLLGVM